MFLSGLWSSPRRPRKTKVIEGPLQGQEEALEREDTHVRRAQGPSRVTAKKEFLPSWRPNLAMPTTSKTWDLLRRLFFGVLQTNTEVGCSREKIVWQNVLSISHFPKIFASILHDVFHNFVYKFGHFAIDGGWSTRPFWRNVPPKCSSSGDKAVNKMRLARSASLCVQFFCYVNDGEDFKVVCKIP